MRHGELHSSTAHRQCKTTIQRYIYISAKDQRAKMEPWKVQKHGEKRRSEDGLNDLRTIGPRIRRKANRTASAPPSCPESSILASKRSIRCRVVTLVSQLVGLAGGGRDYVDLRHLEAVRSLRMRRRSLRYVSACRKHRHKRLSGSREPRPKHRATTRSRRGSKDVIRWLKAELALQLRNRNDLPGLDVDNIRLRFPVNLEGI